MALPPCSECGSPDSIAFDPGWAPLRGRHHARPRGSVVLAPGRPTRAWCFACWPARREAPPVPCVAHDEPPPLIAPAAPAGSTRSASLKALWQDPEYRRRQVERRVGLCVDPERIRGVARRINASPELTARRLHGLRSRKQQILAEADALVAEACTRLGIRAGSRDGRALAQVTAIPGVTLRAVAEMMGYSVPTLRAAIKGK